MTRDDGGLQGERGRGRGRPKIDGSRRTVRGVRFDDEEEAMLEHLAIEFDLNITDVIRKSVRMYYKMMVKRL